MSLAVRGFFDQVTATWTYVVWSKNSNSNKCAIIDSVLDYDAPSGRTSTASADKVINFVKNKKLEVEWILETHIHADHLTASQYIKEQLGGKTAISEKILEILESWKDIFNNNPSDTPLDGSQFDHLFKSDEEFKIGDLQARIINTPGHTPADTTYIIEDAAFAGDTIFMPDVGSGRCDFPGGSAKDSYQSIQKLYALPDSYKIYVGHDYPPSAANRNPACMSTVAEQKTANILINRNKSQTDFLDYRKKSDTDKPVPKLLLPSIQVNLRAGKFGKKTNGTEYIKIPVNKI